MARNLRLLYPELPVVLTSAQFDEQRRQRVLDFGARDLLEKPFTEAQLLAILGLHPL